MTQQTRAAKLAAIRRENERQRKIIQQQANKKETK